MFYYFKIYFNKLYKYNDYIFDLIYVPIIYLINIEIKMYLFYQALKQINNIRTFENNTNKYYKLV